MQKLEPAIIPASEREIVHKDLMEKWKSGDPEIRALMPGCDTEAKATLHIKRMMSDEMDGVTVWKNDLYQVTARRMSGHKEGMPDLVHLSIKRIDRQPCRDWKHFQEIKNQIVGEECEGVELYPAESRLVDSACQYHVFCIASTTYRFPFGFAIGRVVTDKTIGKSKQAPLTEEDKARNARAKQ